MKTRQGFVSNSSSSSFIVALTNAKAATCPFCHRTDVNFFDRVDAANGFNDETKIRARGVDSIMLELKEWSTWSSNNPDEAKRIEREIRLLTEQGCEVAWVELCYHDEALNDEFQALKKAGKLAIILDNN